MFRTWAEQSKGAFEVIDPATGRFLDANERAYEELGHTREEFLALRVFDIDPSVEVSLNPAF